MSVRSESYMLLLVFGELQGHVCQTNSELTGAGGLGRTGKFAGFAHTPLPKLTHVRYNNEGAGGHVTVRDPILTVCSTQSNFEDHCTDSSQDHFWINPFCKSFSYMKPEDLCLVSEEGIVVPPGNMHAINPAGFAIHVAVHKARPDVVSAVHCHSLPTKAFSALGCKLEPINQDACRFYKVSARDYQSDACQANGAIKDHSVYEDFGGVVFAVSCSV